MAVVRFKKERGAKAPSYAYKGDAGLDLYSNEDKVLEPMHRAPLRTGIYFEIPKGYVGLIWDKSGLALRTGVHTLSGVLDSNYRGELKVVLLNVSSKPIRIEKDMKVGQLLLQKIETAKLKEVENLSKTVRGERGFGSSGIRAGKTINNPEIGLGKIKEAIKK